MSVNMSNNNNNNRAPNNKKGGIISFLVVAVLFIAGLLVTGNYKSFLPFIDWGDDATSSYSQQTDYDYEEESPIIVGGSADEESSLPEQTTAATTTPPAATTTAPPAATTEAPSTTTATEAEPEEEPIEIAYTFRNQSTYDSHYEKHRDEFGDITQDEYLELANKLIFSDADTVLTKYAEDGDFMYFDTATGYFLVLSPDDYIRTFFVPNDGIRYWERQ